MVILFHNTSEEPFRHEQLLTIPLTTFNTESIELQTPVCSSMTAESDSIRAHAVAVQNEQSILFARWRLLKLFGHADCVLGLLWVWNL